MIFRSCSFSVAGYLLWLLIKRLIRESSVRNAHAQTDIGASRDLICIRSTVAVRGQTTWFLIRSALQQSPFRNCGFCRLIARRKCPSKTRARFFCRVPLYTYLLAHSLTLPYMVQSMHGLCNGRVPVRRSVCPVDRQQQRRAAGLLLSSGACSRYRSIAASARAAAAGSVMLRAEVRGSTPTCLLTYYYSEVMQCRAVPRRHLTCLFLF